MVIFKGDKCKGGKRSKVPVTILVAANQNGTEKLSSETIGRSTKPRFFSKVKFLPFFYKSNRKSWMNSKIFSKWLKKVDKSMGLKKRKNSPFY